MDRAQIGSHPAGTIKVRATCFRWPCLRKVLKKVALPYKHDAFESQELHLDNYYTIKVKKAQFTKPSEWICPWTPAIKWGRVLKTLICWLITETNTSTSSGTQSKQLPDSATLPNWPDGMLQPSPAQHLDEIKTFLGSSVLCSILRGKHNTHTFSEQTEITYYQYHTVARMPTPEVFT